MTDKPRILFINTLESDGVQDLSYSGLAAVLGAKNVIEYPWNPFYHLNRRRYPANLGYSHGTFLPSIFGRLSRKDFDYVFVAAAKPKCFQTYLSLLDEIPASVPVIYLDGGDFSGPAGDLLRYQAEGLYHEAVRKRPFDAVFKREYPEGEDLGPRVWPLQFSFNFQRMPRTLPEERKYQVAFWAVESNPIRTKVLTLIEEKFDCRQNGTMRNQVFRNYRRRGERYLQELAACKIVLNFPGVGWDTQRYWEIPSLGRFMISMKPRIVIPHNFTSGVHVVYCKDDLSDLIDLCEYYLRHEQEREEIARNARAFASEYHSNIARSQYILQKISTLKAD